MSGETARITKIVGGVMLGLFVYAMLGTATFRMAEAKWGDGKSRGTIAGDICKYGDDAYGRYVRLCPAGEVHDGAVVAGILWPIGLPIVGGIAAGGKLEGVNDALAKPRTHTKSKP